MINWTDLSKPLEDNGFVELAKAIKSNANSYLGAQIAANLGLEIDKIKDISEVVNKLKDSNSNNALKDFEKSFMPFLNLINNQGSASLVNNNKDWLMYIIGCLVVATYLFATIYMLVKPDANNDTKIFMLLIGGLISAFATILGYYFGSSQGSADKTKLLAEQSQTPTKTNT
jgi:hypothetical protein